MKHKISDPDLADRMKRLKEIAGSAQRLSEMSGLGYTTIQQYLSGTADPSRTSLIALSRATGVRVEWIATGEGPVYVNETNSQDYVRPEAISTDVQAVIDAVIEVMLSDDQDTKLALSQNAFTFQRTVRNGREIAELRRDMDIIKKRLLSQDEARETDFETPGPQGGETTSGKKQREGGR